MYKCLNAVALSWALIKHAHFVLFLSSTSFSLKPLPPPLTTLISISKLILNDFSYTKEKRICFLL